MKKHRFLVSRIIFWSFLTISFSIRAQSPDFEKFNKLFKEGQYNKAISALEQIKPKDSQNGDIEYLTGISYSKLQEYDKAIVHFEMAIKQNNQSQDLYYEYGQALYAANELKAARKAFKLSLEKNFNTAASQYYVAHISQILEEYNEAKKNYSELLNNPSADLKIKQIARFQLAETALLIMRETHSIIANLQSSVEKVIIPQMKLAYKADKTTAVATEIDHRILDLEKEFNLDPNLLANGKRISPKRYSSYFSQKIKFDDNISLQNEQNNISQSKRESFIYESELYGKYDYVIKKRIITSPEIRVNFIQQGDQDSPTVYQNDAYTLNLNLKNKIEHNVNTLPASFLIDFEFSQNYKDWKQEHKKIHYANSLNLGIGELFNFFRAGDTSVKFKYKKYTGENDAISNNTKTISADQTFNLPSQNILIALLEADLVNNFNNTSSNTNSYLLRFDFIIPEVMPKFTMDLALATTITDTLEQNNTRGTEITLNPSVDLSKDVTDKIKVSVNYDFTKNKSKLSDYSYQKHVFSTEFHYSF